MCHIFFNMYLFPCWRFDINSVLLFNKLFWLARAIMYFSVRQSKFLVPHLYGVAYAAVLHFRLKSVSLRFNCQICFESSCFEWWAEPSYVPTSILVGFHFCLNVWHKQSCYTKNHFKKVGIKHQFIRSNRSENQQE